MEKIKTTPYPDWKSLHQDLYGFILSKYILLGDVTDIYDLTELAELSVAKTIQMPKEDSKQLDGAHSCEGTTSAMNKKVLLLMALQKGLNIKFFSPKHCQSDRYSPHLHRKSGNCLTYKYQNHHIFETTMCLHQSRLCFLR